MLGVAVTSVGPIVEVQSPMKLNNGRSSTQENGIEINYFAMIENKIEAYLLLLLVDDFDK